MQESYPILNYFVIVELFPNNVKIIVNNKQ